MTKRTTPERLTPADLRARLRSGAVLVDLRDPRVYGAGHIAGSLNVASDSPQLGERIGWFAPPGHPLLLLAETEAEVARTLQALARVGLDDVAGFAIGSAAVRESGLPVATLPNVTPPELADRLRTDPALLVLDVREPVEWDEFHIAGATHIPMREVAARLAELPRNRPIALVCRGGARSSLVGSMLLSRGFTDLVNVWGGMGAWHQAGLPVTAG
jgi:hydroxyacylglutathione hydrolase